MDVIELNLLSGLQQKRAIQARAARFQETATKAVFQGMQPMSESATVNGLALTPAEIEASAGAIVNRSPTYHNHYYNDRPQPASGPIIIEPPAQPAPRPAVQRRRLPSWLWLLVPLLLGLAGLAWYLWHRPMMPTTPSVPPGWTAEPGLKFS